MTDFAGKSEKTVAFGFRRVYDVFTSPPDTQSATGFLPLQDVATQNHDTESVMSTMLLNRPPEIRLLRITPSMTYVDWM